eukprot:gb/GEZN01007385.1/.p1 GENE.gb/GEZN01007385.1/~~gb/GEZN01007385.1/.p1  ORF type:complete len:243 (+),score=31.94 gb/GEZN01007385.1/:667-1395(+)
MKKISTETLEKSSNTEPILVENCCSDCLSVAVESIYTGELRKEWKKDHLAELQKLAELLGVTPLQQQLVNFLRGLEVHEVLTLFAASGDNTCAQAICDSAIDIVENKSFLTLPKDRLACLLQSDEFQLPEVKLFTSLMCWGKAQLGKIEEKSSGRDSGALGKNPESCRLQSIVYSLLPHIRFPLMTLQELSAEVLPFKVLPDKTLLNLFMLLSGQKPLDSAAISAFSSKPRCNPRFRKLAGT